MKNHKTLAAMCVGAGMAASLPLSLAIADTQPTATQTPVPAQTPTETLTVYGDLLESPGLGLDESNSAAGRLGLSAMQTPASISLLSKEEIAIKGDFSTNSALTRATGFASSASPGNGGTSTSVRGFNGHGSVVNTYDGTRLYVGAGTVTFPADSWTLEKVEVLRGPGSVINGVGAIGATVNYVPKGPEFGEVASQLAITAGSNGLQRWAIGSTGSLSEQLAYRIDAVTHQTDGYVDRADETRDVLAGSLLYQATDNLEIKFSVDYADIDAAPYWGTPLVDGKIVSTTRRNNYNVSDGKVEYEDLWPRLSVDWRINDTATLHNTTYYMGAQRHWRNVESYDFNSGTGLVDRSFYLEILHEQRQLGHRTDLLLDFQLADMRNRLSVGGEFNRVDFEHTNNRPYAGTTSVSLNNPAPGTFAAGALSETTLDFRSDTFQYAVFVDDQLELNEQWSLVGGVRADRINFEREDFARTNGEAAGKIDSDFSATSWRLGVVYQPNEATSLYAQTSSAVDSIQSILSASNTDLELSEGKQIEVGLKQVLWNGRLQYTLALFDIEKNNLLSADPGGVTRQIGQQSSRGVEFELFVQATDSLDVDFNIALTDAEYDEFVSSGSDFSGNRPRNVPRKTANLWLNWQAHPDWVLSGGARYVGERYTNDANTLELPDYLVFDAAVRWAVSPSLSLALRGKNLSDEQDYVLAPYGNQWILADGRSAEVTLNYRF